MNLYKTSNALHGSLWDKILFFAIPLALTSLFQQLFNSADVAVVGRFSGNQALAAVGSTSPVVSIFINCLVGTSVGATVVISHLIGEKNEREAGAALHAAMYLAVVFGVLLGALGFFISWPVLQLMGTPPKFSLWRICTLKSTFSGSLFLRCIILARLFSVPGEIRKNH